VFRLLKKNAACWAPRPERAARRAACALGGRRDSGAAGGAASAAAPPAGDSPAQQHRAVLEAARAGLGGDTGAWADFAAWLVGQPAPALQRVFDTFVACARSGQARRPAGRLAGMHDVRRRARAHCQLEHGRACRGWCLISMLSL
jgi:hypothetical protein